MKKITLLLLFVFGLYGCAKENKVYNPPLNVTYNEETGRVSWSSAPKATSYELAINDSRYETTELFYDMSNLEAGIYKVKVRAKYKDNISRYSLPIDINIIKEITVDVTLEEDLLIFNSDTNNIKYKLKSFNHLGALENTVQLEENSYKVVSDLGFKHYEVEGTLNGVLVYTKTIYVNVDGYTYFKGEELMKRSEMKGIEVYLDGTLLDETFYSLSSSGLSIYKSYLETLELGRYVLKVEGDALFLTHLTLSEIEKPTLVSASEVTYVGSDVSFTFKMYGGSLIGIYTTPEITNDDYSFVEGVLMIKKEFIDSVKANEPTRKQMFFQFELLNQELTVVGYLTIRLVD